MKKLLFFTLLLLFSFSLIGCKDETYLDGAFAVVYKDDTPYLINKNFETYALDKYDNIVPEFGEYLLVYNDDGNTREYGYIKNTGEEAIKPKYSSATIFSENKAIVGLDNQLMIIDMSGNVLYTFQENMHSSKLFSEDMLVVEVDGKFTYLSSDFKVADIAYDYAASFTNGYAVVGKMVDNKMQYGLIDKNFKEVIALEYDFLDSYSEGYVRVGHEMNAKDNEYTYQFMRLDGTFLTDAKGNTLTYDYALNFVNGCALVANYTTQEMYGTYKVYDYIDTKGEKPFTFKFNREGEGLYYFDNLVKSGDTNTLVSTYRFKSSGAGAWYVLELYDGVMDAITFTVPEIFNDRENLIYYKSPYDMTAFRFSDSYGPSTPLSRVRIYTGEFGLVDSTGTYVLPAEYDDLFY